ncbi:MAG: YqhA family protein [Lewinellaceae bacterium]|nr:YqhA family protein [Saprospiraceae bacterium]MCB9340732.1 YqhA family protein [Lewinellaceae bacterium]
MLKKLLSSSRYFILIAIAGQFIASIALLCDGAYKIFKIIASMLNGTAENKDAMIGFIETADLFLLAVALYIIALGLYDLFIDQNIEMPEWLNIRDLTDLKKKLLDVVVIILGVVFLGRVVKWNGETEILHFGIGIALVIAALTFFRKPGDGH